MLWLSILFLLLALLDGLITFRVLSVYGLEAELNQITRRFGKTSLKRGIALGIGIPSILLLLLSDLIGAPLLLALIVIARLGFLVKQLDTHWSILRSTHASRSTN